MAMLAADGLIPRAGTNGASTNRWLVPLDAWLDVPPSKVARDAGPADAGSGVPWTGMAHVRELGLRSSGGRVSATGAGATGGVLTDNSRNSPSNVSSRTGGCQQARTSSPWRVARVRSRPQ